MKLQDPTWASSRDQMFCLLSFPFTHQLIFTSTAESFLDPRILPQAGQSWYVQLKHGGFNEHARFTFKGHEEHGMFLIFRILPRNAEFVPCID